MRWRNCGRSSSKCLNAWLGLRADHDSDNGILRYSGRGKLDVRSEAVQIAQQPGTTLVLRSDMTAPIARVVASLLKDEPFPIRLTYHGNVFRAIEEEAGREAEFFQTGVELVGDLLPKRMRKLSRLRLLRCRRRA